MSEQPDPAHLLEAAQDWARRTFPPPSAASGCEHQPVACTWCPVCQLIAALRGERPELTARVVETGTAFAAALRAVLQPSDGAPDASPEPPAERVQRIDLGGPAPSGAD